MSRRGKPDSGQAAIVTALRGIGAHVVNLTSTGAGVPDLAVLFRGKTHWLEVKSSAAASRRKGATADQQRMFRDRAQACGVHVWVVWSQEMALQAIGAVKSSEEFPPRA